MDQRKTLLALGLLLFALGCAAHVRFGFYWNSEEASHTWGMDDAFITYRYAQNLVAGHGLVFNPGTRVEGYSNFLYVLLVAPAFLVSGQPVYAWSVVLNALCGLAACGLLAAAVRRERDDALAWAAPLLFAMNPVLWQWVGSGMETMFVVLLQLAVWTGVANVLAGERPRDTWVLVAVLSAGVLARADGFLLPGLVVPYLFLHGKRRAALVCAAVAGGVIAAHFTWRYAYYGYPFPNTYYAKIAGTLGQRLRAALPQLASVATLQALVIYLGLFFACIAAAVVRVARHGAAGVRAARFEVVLAAFLVVYWLYIGGDALYGRFLMVLYPLGIFTALRLLPRTLPASRQAALLLLLGGLQILLPLRDQRFAYRADKYDSWATLGRFLGERYPGATLAVDAAGKIPFYSGLPALDMLGLNDAHIAHRDAPRFVAPGHSKHDPDYVFASRPEIIAGWMYPTGDMPWGLGRDRFRREGYRLRYLVNSQRTSRPTNIRDATDMDDTAVVTAILSGYAYAVLERVRPASGEDTAAGG